MPCYVICPDWSTRGTGGGFPLLFLPGSSRGKKERTTLFLPPFFWIGWKTRSFAIFVQCCQWLPSDGMSCRLLITHILVFSCGQTSTKPSHGSTTLEALRYFRRGGTRQSSQRARGTSHILDLGFTQAPLPGHGAGTRAMVLSPPLVTRYRDHNLERSPAHSWPAPLHYSRPPTCTSA